MEQQQHTLKNSCRHSSRVALFSMLNSNSWKELSTCVDDPQPLQLEGEGGEEERMRGGEEEERRRGRRGKRGGGEGEGEEE